MLDFLNTVSIKIISIATSLFLFLGIGALSLGIGSTEKDPVGKTPTQIEMSIKGGALQKTSRKAALEKSEEKVKKVAEIPREATLPIKAEPDEEKENAPIREGKAIQTMSAPVLVSTENPPPLLSTTFLNQKAREATVNIFCMTKGGEPISGSGIIISPQGVVLTNAHVAQYFLLKNYLIKDFIECSIRTGNPAKLSYKAELLYLAPSWVEKNSLNLKLDSPTGTGENDFALLHITESATGSPLPKEFSFIPPDTDKRELKKEAFVLVASYPAGFLGNNYLYRDLWLSTAVSQIIQIFTFYETRPATPDLFSIGGTIGAQEGSSGGAIINFKNGKLLGLITTRTNGDTTGERTLRALSMFHIDDSLQKHEGRGLEAIIGGDLEQQASIWNAEVAPELTAILIEVLDR